MINEVKKLISSRTPEIIEKVRNFVANDPCASLRLMEDSLSTNKETIRTTLHEDLGKTKVGAKFVPHTLNSEQKAMRNIHCRDIISVAENDSNFFKFNATGDEFWCFQYDSQTKPSLKTYLTRTVLYPKQSQLENVDGTKFGEKKLSLQEALALLQNLPSEISDILTDDFSVEEVPANNLLEFSLDF
ncbi:FLJ37770-like protein [Trichonephila clavipes]|nr:FLJ37770-like protein [Trichonephila clavipes]